MCDCETDYRIACARRNRTWQLYHQWYNRKTAPGLRMDLKTATHVVFEFYPDILRGIQEGKQIKVLLYSKLREESHLRLRCLKRFEWHRCFNTLGIAFYKQTNVSPTFLFHRVSEYLGKET